ncbi:hypothetical protein RFI_04159 [Reticulomyxa filosa]|uniref:Uncharacterized protein n=1 Tax=Reticulomyxa filosa TaxID=46433 RepID=X6P5R5_RETFI|nr:hypothetical protein RFI_04159 [Reticulomyxa filosa]|eukprot:ETO32947.1 hypothetical protein RFI_04159 [Reticulomyxa filosa]
MYKMCKHECVHCRLCVSVIVFENSLFGIKKHHLWGMYLAGILVMAIVIGLNGWFASVAGCLQYFKMKVPFNVSSRFEICGVIMINIIIGYMYITRMIRTARVAHKNEKLDLAHLGGNPSEHEISEKTMKILMHVKKCGIIALTSTICSFFCFVLTWISNIDFLIFADCLFNGILMLCSFTFAENIFQFCFGCCDKPSQILLSRFIKDT